MSLLWKAPLATTLVIATLVALYALVLAPILTILTLLCIALLIGLPVAISRIPDNKESIL